MADASAPRDEPVATTVQMARGHGSLAVRVASALVMLGITGFALWQGGRVLDGLIGLVALAVLIEFTFLIAKIPTDRGRQAAAVLAGILYIGYAALVLVALPPVYVAVLIGSVAATDTGAFFVGRAIGGPRIAPRISPSKTWAGLVGGTLAAAAWLVVSLATLGSAFASEQGIAFTAGDDFAPGDVAVAALIGAGLAIAAQAGDFLESWIKRRAGVKDSSTLIPGHGGIFDRVDGMLPVAAIAGIIAAWPS